MADVVRLRKIECWFRLCKTGCGDAGSVTLEASGRGGWREAEGEAGTASERGFACAPREGGPVAVEIA